MRRSEDRHVSRHTRQNRRTAGKRHGRVRVGESQTFLTTSVMLLPEPPSVGDYVIVHAGFALHTMTPQEAQESLSALRELAQAMEGTPAPF